MLDMFRLSGAWYEVVSYKPRYDNLGYLMTLVGQGLNYFIFKYKPNY